MICPGCELEPSRISEIMPFVIAGAIGLIMVASMTRAVRLWFIRQIWKVLDRWRKE